MANLPFIIQPKSKAINIKIGNEEIGVFEIERRGYLNVAEKSFVEGFTSSSNTVREIVKISNKISNSTRLSREESYKCLMNVMSGAINSKIEKEVALKYEEEIAELTALMSEVQSKRALAIATVLLQSRVNSEWTLEDTFKLDPLILDELSDLYDQEEAKIKPTDGSDSEESTEDIREILGK